MDDPKYIFIINPIGRKGQNKQLEVDIRKICEKNDLKYEIRHTYRSGAATKIAKEYENEENVIYAVGGDGMISDVVNGIVDSKNMLGVIPAGSGNDFYRTVEKQIKETTKIAVGKINQRYFINTACLGMDADVASNVFRVRKLGIPRNMLYTASIFYTFFNFKYPKVKVQIDDMVIEDSITIFALCNGQYYGGGYHIAPDASLTDNVMDIYFVKKISKFRILFYLLKMKNGKHTKYKTIQNYKAKKITVISQDKIRFNRDGEMLSGKKFEIELIPDKITLFRNRKLEQSIINKIK